MARRQEMITETRARIGALRGAEGFGIDDVIDPRDTRRAIAWGLELSARKKALRPGKKHGVIPV
jgi:acetyl-CoA carboxylase carboxyltransferase component